jgi:hypothetical protein
MTSDTVNSIDEVLQEIKAYKPQNYDKAEPFLRELFTKMGVPLEIDSRTARYAWGWRRQGRERIKTHLEIKQPILSSNYFYKSPRREGNNRYPFVVLCYPNSYLEFYHAATGFATRTPSRAVKLYELSQLLMTGLLKNCSPFYLNKKIITKYCDGKLTDEQLKGLCVLMEVRND